MEGKEIGRRPTTRKSNVIAPHEAVPPLLRNRRPIQFAYLALITFSFTFFEATDTYVSKILQFQPV